MKNYFFDTSAIVKYFHDENGSKVVADLIQTGERQIWVLELAEIEFNCALHRRFRNNEIDEIQLNQALNGFRRELGNFNIEPMSDLVVNEANKLIDQLGKKNGIKAMDSLHLGCFTIMADKSWILVTSDEMMENMGKLLGFHVINPIKY